MQRRSERSTGYREPLDCWRHWTRKSVAAQLVQAVTSGPLICPLPRHEAESAVMELVRSTAMRTPVHPSGLCVFAAPTPSRRLIKILKLVCICFVSCQATPRHGMPGSNLPARSRTHLSAGAPRPLRLDEPDLPNDPSSKSGGQRRKILVDAKCSCLL